MQLFYKIFLKKNNCGPAESVNRNQTRIKKLFDSPNIELDLPSIQLDVIPVRILAHYSPIFCYQ